MWRNIFILHAGWYVNEPRTTIAAISDIDEERLKAYGERYDVEKQYTDFVKMLETEDIGSCLNLHPSKTPCPFSDRSSKTWYKRHFIRKTDGRKPWTRQRNARILSTTRCETCKLTIKFDSVLPYQHARQ